MKQKSRRVLSLVLAVVMLLTIAPLSVFAYADNTMTLTAESVSAQPSETVDVKINLSNNSGIASLVFDVSYDDMLTLKNVTFNTEGLGATTMTTTSEIYTNPQKLSIASPTSICKFNGTIATLQFEVSDEAEEGDVAEIAITFDEDNVFDANLENVAMKVENGLITVHETIPGDINGDGSVNNKDAVLLFRYVAGWQIDVGNALVDLNGDGSVNNKDAVLLFRYVAGWDVKIDPRPVAMHTLQRTEAVAATCTKFGNIEYWYCTDCGKYFSNSKGTKEITLENTVIQAKGHTVVIDSAIPATTTSKGLTEGSHCSVCGLVLVPQEEYGPLAPNTANITYKLAYVETTTANGTKAIVSDDYILSQTIDNSANPNSYVIGTGTSLSDPTLDGYDFLGWYESPETSSPRLYSISAQETGNKTLYGVWSEKTNTITYKLYQTPLADTIDSKYCSYTVSKGLPDLPNPTINNYVFMGWYTNDGKEVTEIPVGTSGNLVLNAYWTSKRNLTKANKSLDDPIIIEDSDNGVIYYAYEIGTIENIPLSDNIWTIQSVAGLAQQHSQTVTTSLSQTKADTISNTISNATVDSGSWTLAEGWNETTSVTQEWAEQHGKTVEEANESCLTTSNTFSITDSRGGSSSTSTTDGTTALNYNSQNYTHGNGAEFGAEVSAKYTNSTEVSAGVKAGYGPISAEAGVKNTSTFEIGGKLSADYNQHQETNEHTGTDTTTVHSTVGSSSSTWNSASTSSSTKTASERRTVSQAVSDIISSRKGYGSSYTKNGQNSETQGFSTTESNSVNSSSSITWSSVETQTTTSTYSTDGKSEGCYRLVIAGKAHVFGVVGYDIASKSYFTYTYSIMDDRQYEFLDYAPDLNFDDCENGVLPFEIPYFVYENSTAATVRTEGLTFRTDSMTNTAKVVGYDGESTDITVPNYITSSGVAYKVTEISSNAFAGKNIRSIILSKFIKELPAGAFLNCNALEQISGYYNVIGAEAFSGCTSLEDYNIPVSVKSIGENAFLNVSSIAVNAISAEFALNYSNNDEAAAKELTQNLIGSAVNSGANSVTISIANIIEGCELTLDVPEISNFDLYGNKDKQYSNLKINSKADNTALNNLEFVECERIPLVVSSDNLKLDNVHINSKSYCLMLSKSTNVKLSRDNVLNSLNGKAIVCKNPSFLSQNIDGIAGFLEVFGNVYVCGSINGVDNIDIKTGEIVYLTEEEFNNYIKGSFTVSFDVNGGNELSESEKTVYYGSAYGELPTPTRDYYTFNGWYTEAEEGTQITVNTTYTLSNDSVLYAHWTLKPVTDWVLETEMPSDAQQVSEKWSYDLTETTSSSASTLEGWTQTGMERTSWGAKQGPVYSNPSNGVRNVTSEQYVKSTTTHYKYYHRYSSNYNGSPAWGTDSSASSWARHTIDLTYQLGNGYYDATYGQFLGSYACPTCGAKNMWKSDGTYSSNNYATRWYYQEPVYTYYYTRTLLNQESLTVMTEGSIDTNKTASNVQRWVKYRAK